MTSIEKSLTLSIIIPAYNEDRHLKACLESIAAQTEKPDEVIVIDNNSADNTAEIVQSYRFATLIKEPRQGLLYARNTGFNSANGILIGRIDADTQLPAGWVHYVKRFYHDKEHLNHALTGGAYFYNIRLPQFWGWWLGQIAFRMNRLLLGHYITYGSNSVIPARLWQNVRNKACSDVHIHEDLDLAIHLHQANYPITYRENLRVGVKMRRVRSSHNELWDNLMWWPRTLRAHGKKTWVLGWLGAVIIYVLSPLGPLMERIARLFGKEPLAE